MQAPAIKQLNNIDIQGRGNEHLIQLFWYNILAVIVILQGNLINFVRDALPKPRSQLTFFWYCFSLSLCCFRDWNRKKIILKIITDS